MVIIVDALVNLFADISLYIYIHPVIMLYIEARIIKKVK
jgi:hypothetical protein